jgi:tetratricopeptide (TPR) repeat protein
MPSRPLLALVLAASALAACGDEPAAPPAVPAAAPGPSPADLPVIRTLWSFADPAASEARFRELLPRAKAAGDDAYLAELLTQLARSQGLQQRFDEADRTLDEAQALLTPSMARARVLLTLERGRVRNSSKRASPERNDEALPLFQAAYADALEAKLDGLAVDAAHMVAIAERGPKTLEWNLKALELAERSTDADARAWLGSLYNNIGWSYHADGQLKPALGMFERALAFRQERKDADGVRIATWCVARCLRSLGETSRALAMQQELEREFTRLGRTDGYVCEELAECLWLLDRKDEARPWFAKAHEVLAKDAWLQRDEAPRLARLARLAGGAAE